MLTETIRNFLPVPRCMTVPSEILSSVIHPPRMFPPVLEACRIRTTDEDFFVEEIPAYVPVGTGEHAFFWIEKRGLSSPELISRISKQLDVRPGDVGLAGQKDRHAVTRQWCSVPRRFADRADLLNSDDLRVLNVTFHKNKLKTGHLKGNRFRLMLRPVSGAFSDAELQRVQARLVELQQTGVPNYFGSQRFGVDGNTIVDGLRLLQGKLPKDHWPESKDRTLRRLALSAVQSAVFNLVLGARVQAGTAGSPQPGDVVIRRDGIKPFLFTSDMPSEFLVPAGPMPGPEMLAAQGAAGAEEDRVLKSLGLTSEHFRRFSKLTSGIRRRMLEFPSEVRAELSADSALIIQFVLSAGAYATVVLNEIVDEIHQNRQVEG